MLKIPQDRFQQYVKSELLYVQARFRKGRGTRDQIANICWTIKKQESSRKTCFIDYAQAFDCVDHNKLWKIRQEMGITNHPTCLLRNCMQVKKKQLELDMEQQTGLKLGKEYIKVCFHLAYLTYM